MVLTLDSSSARLVRVACATLILAMAGAVLTGWALGLPRLRNGIFFTGEPVRPLTAVVLICGALALLLQERRSLSRAFSAITLTLGAAASLQWLLNTGAGLLAVFPTDGMDMRMPLRAAASAVFAGAAGLTLERRPIARIFAAGVGFIAVLSIVAFAYGGRFLPGSSSAHMAPASAALFLIWTFGLIVADTQRVSVDAIAVVSFLTPFAFGAVCLRAAHPPYFDLPFALALLATATGFTLLALARRMRASERKYRRIVETSQDGIFVIDAQERFTFVNDRLAAMLGYEPQQIIGRRAKDFVAPEDQQEVVDREAQRVAGATATQGTVHLVRKDGTRIATFSSTTTLRAPDGSVSGLLGMLTDITARTAAETALRESEQRFRSLYDANIMGVGFFAFDGRVLQANDELLRMYGVPREDLANWRWTGSSAPGADDLDRAALAELETTGRCRPYEKEALRMDGTSFWVLVSATRVDGDGGGMVLAIDITERVEARRALERTTHILGARLAAFEGAASIPAAAGDDLTRQRAQIEILASRLATAHEELETFSYSVSHDLRAPLRAIEGFSRELLLDYQDAIDERGRDYLKRIGGATQRMSRLIEALLDLGRLAHTAVRRETVDLTAIAREITAELPHVRARVTEGLSAYADPRMVRIVLENLIGNAVKFSARTAEPCVEVSGGDSAFVVRDNGTGFDMERASQLFAPFQRLHSSEFEGTGIGLAIVHRIISRHGGAISADSTRGHGATFTFTLGDQTP